MKSSLKSFFHASRRVLASFWLNKIHHNTTQIGITGSYGKTTTTNALYHMIASHAPVLMTDLNLDTIFNVPITALKLQRQPYLIFELGIDTPGEMSFHLEIAQPDIGIMTGITPVHSDAKHLGSLEQIIVEKRKMIEALPSQGTAIMHYDDPYVREMAPHTQAKVLWYGLDAHCHYRAEEIHVGTDGIRFRAVTPNNAFQVTSPLLGKHSAVNLMAAIAVGEMIGIPVEKMQAAFSSLAPLKGRLSIEPGPQGLTLVNDALRANPVTTKAGLAFISALDAPGSKIAILGEMGELGDLAFEKHVEIGQIAAKSALSQLVCVGSLTRHTAEAAISGGMSSERVFSVTTVHEAAEIIREKSRPGDVLYLKGSLLRHMERIPLLLEGAVVGCRVISCHFYHQCVDCPFLEEGYTG